jgi:molybdenum cofactor synthesis domain-containing protein
MSYRDDPSMKKAGLVVIGNEILTGRTHDTNTMWIGDTLGQQGIILNEVRVVPDEEAMIIEAVNDLRARYDLVFTTGGIGPTHDDITAESVAKAFGLTYGQNEKAYAVLLDYYGEADLTPARLKMAKMPVGAALIPNPVSGAPGFNVENVYVMAGVPRIMQAMLDHILGTLTPGKPLLSNTIACGLPESELADDLANLQADHATVEIGSYPHFRSGILGLSLVLRSVDEAALIDASRAVVELVRRLGDEPKALSLQAGDKSIMDS